jgi:alkanesulfonate monooxygenase SsuD/methylene tetrahydromethanopterin reductase-like flavin-dependent oxidoreductase (luciferase family)
VRLGALLGAIDAARPESLAEQARSYASTGYASLWSPQAIGRGFMLTDPFVALSVAATVTDGIELGTAVVQVPLYHPADLAHRVFSLMQASGNRSTESDFVAYSRDYRRRFVAFDTCLAELRAYFADGESGSANLSPWPAVRGGPPVLFGTWGGHVERAAAEFDGWIASATYRTPDQVVATLGRYRAAGGQRAIVSTIQVTADTDLGELGERLDRFAEAGFDDAVVMIMPGGPDPVDVRSLVD